MIQQGRQQSDNQSILLEQNYGNFSMFIIFQIPYLYITIHGGQSVIIITECQMNFLQADIWLYCDHQYPTHNSMLMTTSLMKQSESFQTLFRVHNTP